MHILEERDEHVLLPVSVIGLSICSGLRQLLSHGGNPDGSKSHVLDVVQLYHLNISLLKPIGRPEAALAYLVDDSLP